MSFRDYLKDNILILDGGMGTLLQKAGLSAGELPERLSVSRPELIESIHKAYFEAGADLVYTNTFGANCLKFSEAELEEVIAASVACAQRAREEVKGLKEKYIALDLGPLGRLLSPLGDLDFEDAVEIFAKTVRLGVKYGADLIAVETMNDSYETKAALLAVKENCELPVIVTNAYGEDGKLMTGATPEAMVALLEGMGADAVGVNCSLGPKQLRRVVERITAVSSLPVVLKPNAGLPSVVDGKTVFELSPDEFAEQVAELVPLGVRAVGGCCGTAPEYISALARAVSGLLPKPLTDKKITAVSSYTHAVTFGSSPVLIGERINPTGKKRFKQALVERDIDYILAEGVNQEERGVHILDVNVGLPEIDEAEMLSRVVRELQTVTDLPLQIDTSDTAAMESALRRYNGKAMINSVNGKAESMAAVFPLVKKYGGVVVALTLDESGIPADASGRVEIAKKILREAESYGINKKDIVFDTLAMTVSADTNAALNTLCALEIIKKELGCHTSLGVSNVSFGLPCRDAVNASFFSLALCRGLSAAIMNPYSEDMMKAYYAFRALYALDENCADYIRAAEGFSSAVVRSEPSVKKEADDESRGELWRAVAKGMKNKAREITQRLLLTREALDIVNNEIIPALNEVGEGYEKKTVYLPGLLMSAEAAGAAFEVIKAAVSSGKVSADHRKKLKIVIATVEGDIHDIGKNIVKLLLENYGFEVTDLGKNVPPEEVVRTTLETGAELVGLSALMTTTVPAMEKTVRLLHKSCRCRVVVGGAVLTEEYAKKIGADRYAADAMEAVRYAEELLAESEQK